MVAKKKTASKAPKGRPSSYTEATADAICERISCGANLDQICGQDGFPTRKCVYEWFQRYPEFGDKYARARESRASARADRIDENVRRMLKGEITPEMCRVANDAEKWQAGKEAPKVYGDKLDVTNRLAEGTTTLTQVVATIVKAAEA